MCVRDRWLFSSRTIRFNMGDRAWVKFQAQMKHKRVQGKSIADAGSASIIHQRGELTVQRLSSEVSGKAQKFSRIGAREFVPFAEYEDLTLANINLNINKFLTWDLYTFDSLNGNSNKTTWRSPIQCFSPQTPGGRKEQFWVFPLHQLLPKRIQQVLGHPNASRFTPRVCQCLIWWSLVRS